MPLERLDATPKPTRTFFKRPSQSNAISCVAETKVEQLVRAQEDCRLTLDVDARALTTPVTLYGDVGDSEGDGDETVGGPSDVSSEAGFDRDGRSHHSAPIVHSLS